MKMVSSFIGVCLFTNLLFALPGTSFRQRAGAVNSGTVKALEQAERANKRPKVRNSLYEKQNNLKGQKWKIEKLLER